MTTPDPDLKHTIPDMRMPSYFIKAADRETGLTRYITIKARNRAHAQKLANARGLLVAEIVDDRQSHQPLALLPILAFTGAIVAIIIIASLIATPFLPSSPRDDRTVPSAVDPAEQSASAASDLPPSPPPTTDAPGIGWSVADIERQWGPSRGWTWFIKSDAPTGISYVARNAELRGVFLQVVGPADDLRTVVLMVSASNGDDSLGMVLAGAISVVGRIAGDDVQSLAIWVGDAMASGQPFEGVATRRVENKLITFGAMPSSDGWVLVLGVESQLGTGR